MVIYGGNFEAGWIYAIELIALLLKHVVQLEGATIKRTIL